jgi:hypothetical protein
MNKLAGYKKGDKVEVRTNVIYAGTPQTGEAFETWEQGEVIAEGFTYPNQFGELSQQRIVIMVDNKRYIRNASQIK